MIRVARSVSGWSLRDVASIIRETDAQRMAFVEGESGSHWHWRANPTPREPQRLPLLYERSDCDRPGRAAVLETIANTPA